jgi:ABC-type Na+ efflux pump permease subunit
MVSTRFNSFEVCPFPESAATRFHLMNVMPVVIRELREQSRQGATYWLRWLGAGLLSAAGILVWTNSGLRYQQGGEFFHFMHLVLFWSIWFLVPLLTADCLSRERREGTLGLLFLTPLSPRDLVVAKGLAQALRAATFWSASLPVLLIPFLLGGISWMEVAQSVVVNLSSFWLALGAGLLASSHNRRMHRALGGAMFWAFLLLVYLFLVHGLAMDLISSASFPPSQSWLETWGRLLSQGISMTLNIDIYRNLPPFRPTPSLSLFDQGSVLARILISAVFMVAILISSAARLIRRNWRDEPRSGLGLRMERIFCTPRVARGLFRRWMRRKIEKNPIGWLEQRTWQARTVTWSWLAVLISIYSLLLTDPLSFMRFFGECQRVLTWLLLFSMAATASGSFQRERETGVLELLLVSPLQVRQIISGRLRGIWGQFLPALLLLIGVWIYMARALRYVNWTNTDLETPFLTGAILIVVFLCLPVIGLYFSLRWKHFPTALGWTLLVAFAVPSTLMTGIELALQTVFEWSGLTLDRFGPVLTLLGTAFVQVHLAVRLGRRLDRNLQERKFALPHAAL